MYYPNETNQQPKHRLFVVFVLGVIVGILVTLASITLAQTINANEKMKSEVVKTSSVVKLISEMTAKEEPTAIPESEVVEPVIEEVVAEPTVNDYVNEISTMYGLDPALIESIIYHESRGNPDSSTGVCHGLMQVCVEWHGDRMERLGVTNIFDPRGNILVGVDILSSYLQQGDIGLGLMLYNMNHDEAFSLYNNGQLSWYAQSVMERAEMIRAGTV